MVDKLHDTPADPGKSRKWNLTRGLTKLQLKFIHCYSNCFKDRQTDYAILYGVLFQSIFFRAAEEHTSSLNSTSTILTG